MNLSALAERQPESVALLDAAYDRACEVVGPDLISLATARIDCILRGTTAADPVGRDADIAAVVDQMLIDVAGMDDATAARAARHFDSGGFADFVMASYIIEARTRLEIMSTSLLGTPS